MTSPIAIRDESGTALVEFAFVLPLLLVLVLGIADFGRAFNYWIDSTHLANVAARYAAVNKNPGAPTPHAPAVHGAPGATKELRDGSTQADARRRLRLLSRRHHQRRRSRRRSTVKSTWSWLGLPRR